MERRASPPGHPNMCRTGETPYITSSKLKAFDIRGNLDWGKLLSGGACEVKSEFIWKMDTVVRDRLATNHKSLPHKR
jgi:hypothetical protein